MENLPLFPDPRPGLAGRLAPALAELASLGIRIGTSSWKYEGWLGQIYSQERYLVRGRFSRRRFDAECLAEYAETFPVVCGDFSFYQFPSAEYWRRLFASAPPSLQFAFKVPEEITRKTFPGHERYGDRAGRRNDTYLNADAFQSLFLELLSPWLPRLAPLIFEFGAFSQNDYGAVEEYLADLDRFLAALPAGVRYSVEIRNPEFLVDGYFACLRAHGVAHVYNAWTRMPELERQVALPASQTASFTVTRALLGRGRTYEQAVSRFQPYSEIALPNPGARQAMRTLIERARQTQREAYIFVNNRLEGNAPATIEAIVEPGG